MIQAIKGPRNSTLALCTCDECAAEVSFDSLNVGGVGPVKNAKVVGSPLQLKEPGAVNKRLYERGWIVAGKRIRCPKCEARRKERQRALKANVEQGEGEAMNGKVTDIRRPTREQRRDIRAALDLHYDLKAERYIGGETDLTIARIVGGGCMFGWVAEIRDADYGPDGGNEQIAQVAAAIAALESRASACETRVSASIAEALAAKKEISGIAAETAALQKSIGIIKAAVGPKAERA
jgi:hypothetical protein